MMIRTFIALSMSCSVAVAAATTPPSPPSPPAPPAPPATTAKTSPAPTTLPTATATATAVAPTGVPLQLHEQAIDAMRLGQLDVALALMDKAYNATPPSQRTRPLVLNRAILDLTQQVYVMRAVREMDQDLRANPEPDEPAMNILGAALNATADTPRIKQGALWQSAYKEWERRNYKLNE